MSTAIRSQFRLRGWLLVALLLSAGQLAAKPTAEQAIQLLKEGNARFVAGQSVHPNADSKRLLQAGRENQGDYAYATVLTCSDSRVPVERIFDAGIMDLFVVRVAGNVCDVDEIGSIEYGIAHVKTPVLVVLGHTQCGAVTAVTHALQGQGHALERNIPPLVDNIEPAVRRAGESHPSVSGDAIIPYAIEENVWQAVEDLMLASPAVREAVKNGSARVLGAVYDVGSGSIEWLPEHKVGQIIAAVGLNPRRAMNPLAESGHAPGSAVNRESGALHGSGEQASDVTHQAASSFTTSNHRTARTTAGVSGLTTEQEQFSVSEGLMDHWWFWVVLLSILLAGMVLVLRKSDRGEIRLTIASKILLGFTAVILLLTAVVFIAEQKMREVGDGVQEVTEVYIPLSETLTQIEINAIKQEVDLNAFMIDHSSEREASFSTYGKLVEDELRMAGELVRGHEQLRNTGWESRISELTKQHTEFLHSAEGLLKLAGGGASMNELASSYQGVQAEAADIDMAVEDLLANVQHAFDSVSYVAEAHEKAGFRLILIIGLFSAAIGLTSAWLVSRSISKPLTRVVELTDQMNGDFSAFADVVDRIAQNDLTQKITNREVADIDVRSKDEVGYLVNAVRGTLNAKTRIGRSLQTMVTNLATMVQEMGDNADQLVSAATEVASSSEQMSRGSKTQTEQTIQVSTAVEEMTATIVETSKNAGDVATGARNAAENALTGGQIVNDTIQGMQRIADVVRESSGSIGKLAQSADKIGEIIGVIDDIADQTNLLALNAAIEAARAGEQGRGFAVVADEVRKLAERTSRATGEITEMIRTVQTETGEAVKSMETGIQEVDQGRALADRAGNSLSEIVNLSRSVQDMISQIATAVEEQSAAAEEISKSVEQVAAVARESATGAEQSASAAEQLNHQAERMKEMVARFKV